MANSSMLVLPRITRPAARSLVTMVASYGGRQPSRIFDPHVVGMPRVARTSFSASGTPASGPSGIPAARAASTASAAASAPSVSTCRNAWTAPSTAAIRSRCACATSRAELSPELISPASVVASARVRSLRADIRPPRPGSAVPGSAGPRPRAPPTSGGSQPRDDDVGAEDVRQRKRVRCRRDVVTGNFADLGDQTDDLVELRCEVVDFGVGEVDPGQLGEVTEIVGADGGHSEPS